MVALRRGTRHGPGSPLPFFEKAWKYFQKPRDVATLRDKRSSVKSVRRDLARRLRDAASFLASFDRLVDSADQPRPWQVQAGARWG